MVGAGNNPYGLRGKPDIDPFAPDGFCFEKDGLGGEKGGAGSDPSGLEEKSNVKSFNKF